MAQEILEKLFESPVKARLLKLFLRNLNDGFTIEEATKKTRSDSSGVEKQIKNMTAIGLLQSQKSVRKKKGKGSGVYYVANQDFEFFNELRSLVLKSSPASHEKLQDKLKKLGRVKLAVLSGVFVNQDNGRVDLLLIGDGITDNKMHSFLKEVEAEVGKEVRYAFMDTNEFHYRFSMFDRFILDILERPHEKIINKLGIE